MDAISTGNKGPKTLFELSSLAGEDLANNKQEARKQIKATDYSWMSKLLHVTARGYGFIYKTRIKEKQIGWLDDKELKKPRKHVMFETRKYIINKRLPKENIINSLGLQLDEESLDVMGDSWTL